MNLSHKKTTWFVTILILIALFLLGSLISDKNIANFKEKAQDYTNKKISFFIPIKEKVVVKEKNKHDGRLFSFIHDERLLVSEKNGIVIVTHSVPYNKIDMCDMKNGSDLTNLDDFYMTLTLADDPLSVLVSKYKDLNFLQEYISGETLKTSKDFIEDIALGDYKGYRAVIGAEGCGQEVYILSIGERFLVLNKSVRPELTEMNSNFKNAKLIPGVILKEEAELIFDQIINTLSFK